MFKSEKQTPYKRSVDIVMYPNRLASNQVCAPEPECPEKD